tara:strand:+ start:546 stop:2750 length:2205 start_codon:yes stop_codon:yes gene_type:complete
MSSNLIVNNIEVGAGATIYTAASNQLTFGTDGSENLRINSSGYVGVKRSTPLANLHTTNNELAIGANPTSAAAPNATYDGLVVDGEAASFINIRSRGNGSDSYGRLAFSDDTRSRGYVEYRHKDGAGDDTLRFATAGSERLRIDSSGNIGQSVTPSGWASAQAGDFYAYQVGTGIALFGRGSGDEDRGGIAANYYHTGSAQKYIGNGHAGRIYFEDGSIVFSNAAQNSSGAGAAMTLNERLRINSSGNVSINNTNIQKRFSVKETSTTSGVYYNAAIGGASHLANYAVGMGFDPEGSNARYKIGIVAEGTGTGYSRGKLHFLLDSANDSGEATLSESRMTILDSGNVGINQTAPAVELDIKASTPEIRLTCSNAALGQGATIGQIGWYTTDPTTPTGAGTVSYINTYSATSNGSDYTTAFSNRAGAGGGETKITLGNSLGQIRFYTHASGGGVERLRIDSSGNFVVGNRVGSSSPSSNQPVAFHSARVNPDGADANVHTAQRCNLYVGSNSGWASGDGGVLGLGGSGTGTANQERMWAYVKGSRQSGNGWEYAGYLDLGTAGWSGNTTHRRARIWGNGQFELTAASAENTKLSVKHGTTQTAVLEHTGSNNMRWKNPSSGNFTFDTSSDYRLKKDETVISNALTTVKALKPYQFTWKHSNELGQGFFAHEAQAVLPDIGVVSGTKDGVHTEDDRNESYKKDDPIYQGIDYSKLVPLLTAAIQELEARVASLESS